MTLALREGDIVDTFIDSVRNDVDNFWQDLQWRPLHTEFRDNFAIGSNVVKHEWRMDLTVHFFINNVP
jgi:hypothetical protein